MENIATRKFVKEHGVLIFIVFWAVYIFITFQLARLSVDNDSVGTVISVEEKLELERKLIERYGSLEAAEEAYIGQNEPSECFTPPLCR